MTKDSHFWLLVSYSFPGENPAFDSETGICPETAALEFVCIRAGIKEVVICGHSDCRVGFYKLIDK